MSSQYQGFNWNGATGINGTLSLSNSFGVTQNSRVGIGTTTPSGSLSVTPPQYSIGTASQSGNTITGVGTAFTAAMVGSQFVFANGTSAGTITGFTSPTILTVSTLQTVAVQAYYISYTGLQVSSTNGNVGIGTTVPTNILSLGNASAQKIWIENTATDVSGRALTVAAGGTVAGTSVNNVSGGQLILQSGSGTGTGDSSIAFQTATTLTTGTTLQTMSTKMTILGNGNVGIGTLTPNGALSVVSTNVSGLTTSSAINLVANSLTSGTGVYAASSTLTTGKLLDLQVSGTAAAASQTALNILTAGANATAAITTYGAQISNTHTNATSGTNVALYLNASGATTANYGLIVNAGNVGIGIAAPLAVLNVKDARNANSSSLATSATGATVFIQPKSGSGYVIAFGSGPSDYPYMQFVTTDGLTASSMLLNPYGGNVGIGTTAPSYKLELVGTANSDIARFGDGTRNLTIATYSPNSGGMIIKSANENRLGFGAVAGSILIGRAYISSFTGQTDGLLVEGSVGIGTTAPDYKLDINSSSSYKTLMLRANAIGTRFDVALEFNAINVITSPYARIALQVTSASSAAEVAGLTFWTINNGTFSEKMCITGAGNVGINKTIPLYKLQVEGSGTADEIVGWFNNQGLFSSSIAVRNSNKTAYLTNHQGLSTPTYTGQLSSALALGVGAGVSPIQFWNGSPSSAKMTILENGNVGIDTTAPIHQLQVGTSGATVSIGGVPTTNGTGRLKFLNTNSTKNWQISINDAVAGAFEIMPSTTNGGSTFTTPAMLISSTGNVGIGTTAPQSKLQVIGTTGDVSGTAGLAAMMSLQSGSGTDLVFGSMAGSPFTSWIQHRHATINNAYYALALNPLGGNVGIGTTSPSTLLHVNGNITATFPGSSFNYGSVSAFTGGVVSYYSSDRRLKTNINAIEDGLSVVRQLKPSTFNLIADNYATSGFIAQDVLGLIPGGATITPDDGMLAFNINPVVAYMAKAIQELDKAVKEQQVIITNLMSRIVILENK